MRISVHVHKINEEAYKKVLFNSHIWHTTNIQSLKKFTNILSSEPHSIVTSIETHFITSRVFYFSWNIFLPSTLYPAVSAFLISIFKVTSLLFHPLFLSKIVETFLFTSSLRTPFSDPHSYLLLMKVGISSWGRMLLFISSL